MTPLRLPGRHLVLLLLLYLTADLTNPFTPGVFSFENDALFVDAVVQLASHASTDLTPMALTMPSARLADCDDGNAAVKVRTVARSFRPPHIRWKSLKHDDSTAFAFSSPSDSSPTPPQS